MQIPDFLNRKINGIENKPVRNRKNKWAKMSKPKPPKSNRWKDAQRVKVHLTNECERIGSGHRIVWAKVGRKWVYLTDGYIGFGKVDVKTFNKIIKV